MSQIDTEENFLPEDTAGQISSDGLKLVPVAESIRYRKRAQSAERQNEVLAEQLKEARSDAAKTAEQLERIRAEQELMKKLAAEGTTDLEAATLIVKARMNSKSDADLDGVIEQLKKEKQYLFSRDNEKVVAAGKTAGARDEAEGNRMSLERAAKRAATTGNRTDLREYLRQRRSFV
jgi:hypothetical protein